MFSSGATSRRPIAPGVGETRSCTRQRFGHHRVVSPHKGPLINQWVSWHAQHLNELRLYSMGWHLKRASAGAVANVDTCAHAVHPQVPAQQLCISCERHPESLLIFLLLKSCCPKPTQGKNRHVIPAAASVQCFIGMHVLYMDCILLQCIGGLH